MPKDLKFSVLLDYYGKMLTDKQRDVLGLYYNEDLSLSEISQIVGTSRQGVMDIIKRSEVQLISLDEKLSLTKLYKDIDCAVVLLKQVINSGVSAEIKSKLKDAIDKLSIEEV